MVKNTDKAAGIQQALSPGGRLLQSSRFYLVDEVGTYEQPAEADTKSGHYIGEIMHAQVDAAKPDHDHEQQR